MGHGHMPCPSVAPPYTTPRATAGAITGRQNFCNNMERRFPTNAY
jgi:hypothetical protein